MDKVGWIRLDGYGWMDNVGWRRSDAGEVWMDKVRWILGWMDKYLA
jgi:hypothetical protein